MVTMDSVAKHIIFKGRVQGVGFRFTAISIANRYRLTGLVRNLPDGTVEMIAQGHPDDIANSIRDVERTYGANIKETRIEEIPFNTQYKDFKIAF